LYNYKKRTSVKEKFKNIKFKKIFTFILTTLLLISLTSCSRIDRRKFENLYNIVKKTQGSLFVGVNYVTFGAFLQKISGEILIAGDKVKTSEEKELLARFIKILDVYEDSYKLWKEKIERGDRSYILDRNDIFEKYKYLLSDCTHQTSYGTLYFSRSCAMQKLWGYADFLIKEVSTTLYPKKHP